MGQELKGIILACISFCILWKHCGTANFLPVNQFRSLSCSLCAVPLQSMERDLLPTATCNRTDQKEHKPKAAAHVSRCNYILPWRKNKRVHQILNAQQENSTNLLDVLSFIGWFEPNESAYLSTKNLWSHRRFQKCQNPVLPSRTTKRTISPTHFSAQANHCIHGSSKVSGPSSSGFDSAGIRESKGQKNT